MALTKVAGDILDPGLSIAGVVTATAFDGPFRGGSGSDVTAGVGTFTQLDVNGPADFTGIVTFSHTQDSTSASTGTIQVAGGVGIAKSVYIGGDLVVNGTTTTIDTTLKAVDRIEVADNSTNVAVAITQSGSGDIFNLYDGSSEVFSAIDGGDVGIARSIFHLGDTDTSIGFPSTNAVDILAGGKRVRLTSDGNLGINRNTPAAPITARRLDAGGSNTDGVIAEFANSTGYGVWFGQSSASGAAWGSTTNDFYWCTNGLSSQVERLRITSAGKIGIGITNPYLNKVTIKSEVSAGTHNWPLHLLNTTHASDSRVGIAFQSNNNTTSSTWDGAGIYGANDGATGACHLIFGTVVDNSFAERMRLYHVNTNNVGQVKITAPNSGDMLNLQNSTGGGQGLIFGVNTTNHTTYWKNNSSSFYDAAFILGGDEKIRFTGEGFVGIGTTNPSGNVHIQTESGTYDPLVIERKGSANWGIKPYANTLFFRSNSDGSNSFNSRDRFGLAWDGTDARGADVQFFGTAAGVTSCYWDASLNRLKLHDGVKLNFGDGDDGDLYVGSDSVTYFRNQTGQIVIRAASDVYISDYAGNHRAGFRNDSAVDLYYDIENNATAKLSTTVDGISVHGQVETATQDFPDYRPRLNWNFASEKRLDPRITYTRTGQASYVDEFGIVQTVSDDQPRFDHDPLTGECKGLLIEDQRTNQIKDSYNLVQQSWVPVNLNRRSFTTETLAPNGKYEATKLILSTDANQHYTNHGNMTKANGAERQCVSFWAKLTSSNYPILKSYITGAGAFTNYSEARFNLSTGAVDGVSGSGGFTNHSVKMTKYPNGWYKCEYEATLNSSETTKRFQLLGNNGSGNAGNGIDGYYIWGVQVEVGDFATSYIPTSTGQVVGASDSATQSQVRGGDQVGMLGDNHTNIWNDQEGSYVIDYTPLERAAGNGVIIGSQRTTNGSGYPWPLYRHDAANSNVFKSYDLDHGIVTVSGTWADRREVWALGFNTTNGSIARNGTMMQTNNTNMTGLTNVDQLWLGSSSSGSYYSMHLRRFMYYGKRLTKPQLQTMSQ